MDMENQVSLTYLLNIVRKIDFNFSVKETPFSVKISIKKTKIKYQKNTEYVENHVMEKICDCNKMDQIKAFEIKNGAVIAQISKLSHELTNLQTEVEELSIENESLQKSSKSFEQKIIVLNQNLERNSNKCEISTQKMLKFVK